MQLKRNCYIPNSNRFCALDLTLLRSLRYLPFIKYLWRTAKFKRKIKSMLYITSSQFTSRLALRRHATVVNVRFKHLSVLSTLIFGMGGTKLKLDAFTVGLSLRLRCRVVLIFTDDIPNKSTWTAIIYKLNNKSDRVMLNSRRRLENLCDCAVRQKLWAWDVWLRLPWLKCKIVWCADKFVCLTVLK